MVRQWTSVRWWIAAWAVLALGGGAVLARIELAQMRETFETNARIMHRLLSQRVVQHDAILATLALLQPGAEGLTEAAPEQRLPALYPQILAVQRRDRDIVWTDPALVTAERESRQLRRATLAGVDFAAGRYRLVLAAQPASFALTIDVRAMVPWAEWPLDPATSPVRAVLEQSGQAFELQPGQLASGGWAFEFRKHLAADSQPFDVVATRTVGWDELPWSRLLLWAAALAAALAWLRHGLRQRAARARAEELLRLGQVARLNTLGELAAGMAHELNQPLTAVMASTQAARRLLADDPPELGTARGAMDQAVEQARRASEVVVRLRRAVERPDLSGQTQVVDLADAVRRALYLLEPECQRRGVTPVVEAATPVTVMAEPVALDQIIHNLLMNALQALEQSPAQRALTVRVDHQAPWGRIQVIDSGPGIAPDALPRIFEPFFSTRAGGLGLGLSLCETLALHMGGALAAGANEPRGAVFTLTLPLSPDAP